MATTRRPIGGWATRILLRALVLVVGIAVWHARPARAAAHREPATLSCDSQSEAADPARPAEQKLVVTPPPLSKRLSPSPVAEPRRADATPGEAWLVRTRVSTWVSCREQSRVYRHVPRLECGEPPGA